MFSKLNECLNTLYKAFSTDWDSKELENYLDNADTASEVERRIRDFQERQMHGPFLP